MRRLRELEWEAIAGIIAAAAALVLHLLHIAEASVLLAVALAILALLLLRDLRGEPREERQFEHMELNFARGSTAWSVRYGPQTPC